MLRAIHPIESLNAAIAGLTGNVQRGKGMQVTLRRLAGALSDAKARLSRLRRRHGLRIVGVLCRPSPAASPSVDSGPTPASNRRCHHPAGFDRERGTPSMLQWGQQLGQAFAVGDAHLALRNMNQPGLVKARHQSADGFQFEPEVAADLLSAHAQHECFG